MFFNDFDAPNSIVTNLTVNLDGTQTYAAILVPTQVQVRGETRQVPLIFVLCSGKLDQQKLEFGNKVIVEWQMRHKMEKPNEKGCPWYSPSTQSGKFRAFIGHMGRDYDWRMTNTMLQGFSGALHSVMEDVFKLRVKEWVSL